MIPIRNDIPLNPFIRLRWSRAVIASLKRAAAVGSTNMRAAALVMNGLRLHLWLGSKKRMRKNGLALTIAT
jgi:hypothetical protein